MIAARLAVNALFIVLGVIIAVRVSLLGIRLESLTGFIFAAALIALGVYRLRVWSTYR